MKDRVKRVAVREPDEFVPPVTPLWAALRADDEDGVCALLATGLHDPNQRGDYDGAPGTGGPALGYALVWGLDRAVVCLLEAGADPHGRAHSSEMPVVSLAQSAQAVRAMAGAGADVNARHRSNGQSVLHVLAHCGTPDAVVAAIELGADVHHRDAWGHSHGGSAIGRGGTGSCVRWG